MNLTSLTQLADHTYWLPPDATKDRPTLGVIVHQRLSMPIAEQVFRVTAPGVLSAISCHTTLKANALGYAP